MGDAVGNPVGTEALGKFDGFIVGAILGEGEGFTLGNNGIVEGKLLSGDCVGLGLGFDDKGVLDGNAVVGICDEGNIVGKQLGTSVGNVSVGILLGSDVGNSVNGFLLGILEGNEVGNLDGN